MPSAEMPAAEVRWRRVLVGGLGAVGLGVLAMMVLTESLQTREGTVELLDVACEQQLVAAAAALGWSSVAAYKKNLLANGKPIECVNPSATAPQMSAVRAAKLALTTPHAVVHQHSDNIIKWMFGDLFDDTPKASLHPTALHLAGKPLMSNAATAIRRDDGSRVRRTAAERLYDQRLYDRAPHARDEREADQDVADDKRESRRQSDRDDVGSKEREVQDERKELKEREAQDREEEAKWAAEVKEMQIREERHAQRAAELTRVADDKDDADKSSPPQQPPLSALGDDSGREVKHAVRSDERPAPAKQLKDALQEATDIWGDKAVRIDEDDAHEQLRKVAVTPARQAINERKPRAAAEGDSNSGVSADEVAQMAAEAKALGYQLEPSVSLKASLEEKARELGYSLVPRGGAPDTASGGRQESMGTAADGERYSARSIKTDAAKLELLAEDDVQSQMMMQHKSAEQKRLDEQAKLEEHLRMELEAQDLVKKSQLRLQAAQKRAAEHKAANEAISHYGNMLSFPDEEKKSDMKLLEESRLFEREKDKESEMARKSAQKMAQKQLSQYNLLSFEEDEFKNHPFQPLHTQEEAKASSTRVSARLMARGGDLPQALERATLALAAARSQIAKDAQSLASAPLAAHSRVAAEHAVTAAARGAHAEVAAHKGVARGSGQGEEPQQRATAPTHAAVKGSEEVKERGEGRRVKARLSWNGRGIPRF